MDKFERLHRYVCRDYVSKSEFSRNGYTFAYFESEKSKWQDGFSSDALVGRIVLTDSYGKRYRTESMVIKVMLEPKRRTKYIDLVFANEMLMYNRIIPFFSRLGNSVDNLFAKYYYGSLSLKDDDEEGSIMLENLNEKGYSLAKFKIFLDLQHVQLVLKKLGEFHAHSYQAKKLHPEVFFSLMDNLRETHHTCTKETPKGYFSRLNEKFFSILRNDHQYRDKVEIIGQILRYPEEFLQHAFTTREEPVAVLCHGDFLRNNLLFRYTSDGNPVDVKFIDLANSRYCSPVVDLASILYMNTDQHTRNLHWDDLVNVYYDSLKNTFPNNDLIPSRDQIVEEFNRKSLLAYLCVSYFLPMMLESEQNPNRNWLRMLYTPEYEQYKDTGWFAAPVEVSTGLIFKIAKGDRVEKVLDVLKDIIDREFV